VAATSVARLAPSPQNPPHVVRGRQRLVEAATALFSTKSYHETSVGDVASKAGISVGAVYLYIETKSDLLFLILNEVVERYRERVYLISDMEGSSQERLSMAIREYYLVLDRHHVKTEIMYHEFGALMPDVKKYLRQAETDLEQAFVKIINAGIESAEFSSVDADLYARNILWIGHLWALNRGGVRRSMSIEQFISAETEFFLRAMARS
jgi:AcrR family transcriptional regulator